VRYFRKVISIIIIIIKGRRRIMNMRLYQLFSCS